MKKALLCAALALALAACGALPTAVPRNTGPFFTPTSTRKPRLPRPTKTPEQAETPPPESSPTTLPFQLASPLPTLPFTPTVHPTLPFSIVTSRPTLSLASPPPTRPGPRELDCLLVWQSPASVATYFVEDKFSVGWNLRNTGTATWEPGTFEFTYLAGTKLATHDSVIPLTQSVAPGDEIVLSVPMKAPLHPSLYTTHWGIKTGNTYFCRLTLTIQVQERADCSQQLSALRSTAFGRQRPAGWHRAGLIQAEELNTKDTKYTKERILNFVSFVPFVFKCSPITVAWHGRA